MPATTPSSSHIVRVYGKSVKAIFKDSSNEKLSTFEALWKIVFPLPSVKVAYGSGEAVQPTNGQFVSSTSPHQLSLRLLTTTEVKVKFCV